MWTNRAGIALVAARGPVLDAVSPRGRLLAAIPGGTVNFRSFRLTDTVAAPAHAAVQKTTISIIAAVSFCHLINDIMQSMLMAIYPIIKQNYGLDFVQIGLLTFTFQVTASLLQPVIGIYTDRRPMPYSLAWGMSSTLVGLVVLGFAANYGLLLLGSALIGFGSAVFHHGTLLPNMELGHLEMNGRDAEH
ncbi:MAG TPA: MFS transporter, partial [Alphaproteobacteria bacterium]|nr:MFS transporter [Alphaproteobacteria bacterium]